MLSSCRQQGQTNRKDLLELMMTVADETNIYDWLCWAIYDCAVGNV